MPKEKVVNRTQSRRAASKEALKQMHLLLGDEKRYEISSDEDDVIEVEVQPPKKKYKLSHRKSSDGNDRDVIVLKSVDENPFDLEVVIEDLAPCQKSRLDSQKKEQQEVDAKIKQLLSTPNSEVVYNGVYTTGIEISEQIQSIINSTTIPVNPTPQYQPPTLSTPTQSVASQSIVLQQQSPSGNNALPQSYQLVMDPRLGVIVGAVSSPNASTNTPPLQLYPKVSMPTTVTPVAAETQPSMKTRRGTVLRQVPANAIPSLHKPPPLVQQKGVNKVTPGKIQVRPMLGKPVQTKSTNLTPKSMNMGPKSTNMAPKSTNVTPKSTNVTPKAVTTPQKPILPLKVRQPTTANPPPNFRPTESNVEGGLSMGTKSAKSIDLTGEDGRAVPDSREVSFNKLQGRTYPSLVVVARPHLRVKDLSVDRSKLDVKVKSVLMYPPTKFTEWLIQQGLVKSDQKCSVHPANPLKLGMYSDASKFPYSGGYVWISECCPQRFVSVFSGSLFEGSQHPPMSILKLLYHWCCQTIVQNVTQWVKVDNLYVKGMYTWLRSVCTVALQTHVSQLGGPGVKVQVGVISLGTTSQDGNKREVKVEVLGILETTTKHIRLRAVEPLTDGERNYKKRFTKILEPVFNWVHPASIIVTDLTVDKATLHQMGFLHVTQNTSTDYSNSNRTIMEYLRRIVPRMFQNTLSLLSRQIIQQFLDELVWREWYGTTVLQCFDNMVQHLSEQTRFDSNQSLITRLNKVSANPFKNWAIPVATTSAPSKIIEQQQQPTPKRYNRQRKTVTPQPPPTPVSEVMRPSKSTSPDVPEQLVPLENYYYGTIPPVNPPKNKVTINIKCPFCKMTFNTNISLMNHLFKHAHNVSNDVQLCKYCLTIVPTAGDLLKHIGASHPDETKFDNGFVCLICESHFRNPFILGKHMSKEHCPSELPYLCGTCSFRCSNHKQAVDHFYQQHDEGTTIQCPFCLKSTTIYSGGRNISQNMNYFIQHLQKHQKKQLAKRCGRCVLWFIQKEFLKDHQTKMHVSQRGKEGLVPAFAPRNGIMVPKSRMDKCPDDAKIINFSTLHFNVNKSLNCKECGQSLSTSKHFASFESCQNPNCQFSTCCTVAMQEHVAKCKFLNSKIPNEKLPYEMFCICGYSDTCGNKMAKHLAICERKSAYPSQDAAKNATVTHSMLDVLGLVRKPEEATCSKEPPREEELYSKKPIILKHRGRPRKHPPPVDKAPVKEVIEVKDDDVKQNEVQINISDVRGGVESTDDVKEKEKTPEKVDLTEDDVKENDGTAAEPNTSQEKVSEAAKGDKEDRVEVTKKVEEKEDDQVVDGQQKNCDKEQSGEVLSESVDVEKEKSEANDTEKEENEKPDQGTKIVTEESSKAIDMEKEKSEEQHQVGEVVSEEKDEAVDAEKEESEEQDQVGEVVSEEKDEAVDAEKEESEEQDQVGEVVNEEKDEVVDTEKEENEDQNQVGEVVSKENDEAVNTVKEKSEEQDQVGKVAVNTEKEENEEQDQVGEVVNKQRDEAVDSETKENEEQEQVGEIINEEKNETVEREEVQNFVGQMEEAKEEESVNDEKQAEEVQDNETVSETNKNQLEKAEESESMEVDSCINTDDLIDKVGETVAIENSEENAENTKDICPMDTD